MRVLGLIVSLILGVPEPSAVAAASETELHTMYSILHSIHLGDEEEPKNQHAADYNDNSTEEAFNQTKTKSNQGKFAILGFFMSMDKFSSFRLIEMPHRGRRHLRISLQVGKS